MQRIGSRFQQTLQRTVAVRGTGFVTGAYVRLRFRPAAADHGVAFLRTDLPGAAPIQARGGNVTGTARRTTLGSGHNHVSLVEHVLAALAGLKIDNCLVEVDAPEPPGMDGSAAPFVQALQVAGTALQFVRRDVWTPRAPITIRDGGATITLYPGTAPALRGSYFLDYGNHAAIDRQRYVADLTAAVFISGVAASRTFVTLEEANALRQQGLGSRTTFQDLIVFGPKGPMHNRLRWANEPARHKLLDVLGDLALFGHDLAGHVVAYRSGHALNVALVQALLERLPSQQERPQPRIAA